MIPAEYGRLLVLHKETWQPILEVTFSVPTSFSRKSFQRLTKAQIDVEALPRGTCHMRFRGPTEGVDHLQRIFGKKIEKFRAKISHFQPAIAFFDTFLEWSDAWSSSVAVRRPLRYASALPIHGYEPRKFQASKNILLVVDKDTTLNAWTVVGFSEHPESVAWLATVLGTYGYVS